ncbi:hypothetical protein [Terrabacter carboxydivorans]|uniref:hypothetical protein n=1 Tax=Terrabacter carboxydivorans TaxID=619730 RepID=UPI0031D4BE1C
MGLTGAGCQAVGRGAYRAVLERLDPSQLDPLGSRRPTRADTTFDAFVCGLLAAVGLWSALSGSWAGCVTAAVAGGLAVVSVRRLKRGACGPSREDPGQR